MAGATHVYHASACGTVTPAKHATRSHTAVDATCSGRQHRRSEHGDVRAVACVVLGVLAGAATLPYLVKRRQEIMDADARAGRVAALLRDAAKLLLEARRAFVLHADDEALVRRLLRHACRRLDEADAALSAHDELQSGDVMDALRGHCVTRDTFYTLNRHVAYLRAMMD